VVAGRDWLECHKIPQLPCYPGEGPWPDRLRMVRTVDHLLGRADTEAIIGELIRAIGNDGWAGMVARLRDPGLHSAAIRQLGQQQDCDELADSLTSALAEGSLTNSEADAILAEVRSRPPLPPYSDQPSPLNPLEDYPESWHTASERDPGFTTIELTPEQQEAYEATRKELDA
jgi:hypothetical protein